MTRNLLTIAGLFAALTATSLQAAPRTPESDARQSFEQVRTLAAAAAEDANRLSTMIQTAQYSRQSQIDELEAVKFNLNAIGRQIVQLDAERSSLPAWQQEAFDRILPLAQNAAASTTQAIQALSASATRLWGTPNDNLAQNIERDTTAIASALRDALKTR